MPDQLTERQKVVLAAMAAVPAASFESVQVQKLFFIIDEKLDDELGGKKFDFQPYHYGPFDKSVYEELEALSARSLVIIRGRSHRSYSLSLDGQQKGNEILLGFDKKTQSYMEKLSTWIRGLSFSQLVGSIYNAFPEMRQNSIFQD